METRNQDAMQVDNTEVGATSNMNPKAGETSKGQPNYTFKRNNDEKGDGEPDTKVSKRDPKDRNNALLFILTLIVRVFACFGHDKKELDNITLVNHYSVVAYNMYQMYRQFISRKPMAKAHEKQSDIVTPLRGSAGNCLILTVVQQRQQVEQTLEDFGLDMGRLHEIAASMWVYIAGTKYMMDEVRFGLSKIRTGGKDQQGNPKTEPCQKLGLSASQCSILHRINFPPSMRSSVASSLPIGSMCYCYHKSGNNYNRSWGISLAHQIKNMPKSEELLSILKDKGDAKTIMPLMFDYSSLGYMRTAFKANMPASFLIKLCEVQEYKKARQEASTGTIKLPRGKVVMLDENLDVKNFDFVGVGLFNTYSKMMKLEFKYNWKMPARDFQEILMHSMFNTHLSDLRIPGYMTGRTLKTRGQFEKEHFNVSETPNSFKPIEIIRFGRMAQGSVSHDIRNSSRMIAGIHPLSVTATMSSSKAMKAHLLSIERGEDKPIQMGVNPLMSFYKQELRKVGQRMDKGEHLGIGTTGWYNITGIDMTRLQDERYGPRIDFNVTGAPYFFWGEALPQYEIPIRLQYTHTRMCASSRTFVCACIKMLCVRV